MICYCVYVELCTAAILFHACVDFDALLCTHNAYTIFSCTRSAALASLPSRRDIEKNIGGLGQKATAKEAKKEVASKIGEEAAKEVVEKVEKVAEATVAKSFTPTWVIRSFVR